MCLAAIYWAHLDKIYYANTKTDAKNIGFDDSFIYDEIALDPNLRKIETTRLLSAEAITAFERWTEMDEKMEYWYWIIHKKQLTLKDYIPLSTAFLLSFLCFILQFHR